MALISITIEVDEKDIPFSLFKARSLMRRIRPTHVEVSHDTLSKSYKIAKVTARLESIYDRCPLCYQTFRIKKGGGLVRHACDEG